MEIPSNQHPNGVPAASSSNRTARAIEFALLFVALPASLWFIRQNLNRMVIPLIILVSLLCWLHLKRDPLFDKTTLSRMPRFKDCIRGILVRLAIFGGLTALGAFYLDPERFAEFPRHALPVWMLIMVLYPLLSAYPQEIIFRVFLFHRYRDVFKGNWMIVASAVSFAIAHAFLGNWIAPALTLLGGVMFSQTYMRSRSLNAVSLEHGLWGDLVFTVGLGWYFYSGAIKAG